MGDPSAYGLGGIDWSQIIADQPENGSFVGPDGTDPNGFTPGDYNELDQFNAGLGDPPADGGSGQTLGQLFRALGLSNGDGAAGLMSGLLPILASIYNGNRSRQATEDATRQAREDLGNTQTQISGVLNGASAGFQPYVDAGAQGLAGMQAFPQSNLAGNFRPIGSGRGISLAQLARG
jgi:hypothetical protein